MFKINDPIRVVCTGDDKYDFAITREFKKIEANEEVFSFIEYLKEKKMFDKNIVDEYVKSKNILNKESYDELFSFLIKNKLIIDN